MTETTKAQTDNSGEAVGEGAIRRIFPLFVLCMWVVAGVMVAQDTWSGLNTILLVEAAVSGKRASDAELWGAKGYTFTERGEHVWGELSRLVGKKAVELGYLKDPEEQALEKEKALEQAGFEAISWGLNSRGKAERASRTLGWKATRGSIEDEVEEILKAEHARLQK